MEKIKTQIKTLQSLRIKPRHFPVDLQGLSSRELRLVKTFVESLKRKKQVENMEQSVCIGTIKEIKRKIKTREGLNKEERRLAIKAGLIDKDQEWFWTPEWQAKEKEADEDTKAGRYRDFDSMADMIRDLKSDV